MDVGGRATQEQLPEILTYSVYAPFLISILPCTASLHGDFEQALRCRSFLALKPEGSVSFVARVRNVLKMGEKR